jgi:hypothetical protein
MAVDVTTETMIQRPLSEVADFVANPNNAPVWYVNIKAADSVAVGSRVAFVAHFLGRRLAYVYEIVEFVRGERLVMKTAEGPFPMETTYVWESTPEGYPKMQLRNRGTPTGFSRWFAPFMAGAVRRANRKDLARLKALLEGGPATAPAKSRPTIG